jgi:hypothetical protein
MFHLSITPRIAVTIGGLTRVYLAYVTTAPADLDLPKTITVEQGPLGEVIGLAADPVTVDAARTCTSARVVLVESGDRAWQRATYRGSHHLLLEADRWLVSLEKLESSLWQRLERPVAKPVAA